MQAEKRNSNQRDFKESSTKIRFSTDELLVDRRYPYRNGFRSNLLRFPYSILLKREKCNLREKNKIRLGGWILSVGNVDRYDSNRCCLIFRAIRVFSMHGSSLRHGTTTETFIFILSSNFPVLQTLL